MLNTKHQNLLVRFCHLLRIELGYCFLLSPSAWKAVPSSYDNWDSHIAFFSLHLSIRCCCPRKYLRMDSIVSHCSSCKGSDNSKLRKMFCGYEDSTKNKTHAFTHLLKKTASCFALAAILPLKFCCFGIFRNVGLLPWFKRTFHMQWTWVHQSMFLHCHSN